MDRKATEAKDHRSLEFCANGHPGHPANEECVPCLDEGLAFGGRI